MTTHTHTHDTPGLDLAVDALAVYRLTRLVTEDTILDRPRDWILENAPDRLAYLVSCPFCVSIYAGGLATLARTVFPRAWTPLSRLLALSAATSLKTEFTETFGT